MKRSNKIYRVIPGKDDELPALNFEDDEDGLPVIATPKKKVSLGSGGLKIPSVSGGVRGISGHQLVEKKIEEPSLALGVDKDDPVKSILDDVTKDMPQMDVRPQFSGIDATGIKQPIFSIEDKKKVVTNKDLAESADRHDKIKNATEFVKQTIFPTGIEAKNYINHVVKEKGQAPVNNATFNMAQHVAQDYDVVGRQLEETGNIEDAAIKDYKFNNPSFSEKYDVLAKNTVDGRVEIPKALLGRVVAEYLYKNGRNIEAYSKEHPQFEGEFKDLKDNLLTKYIDFGVNVVANEISRKRQEMGLNSRVANFDTKSFDKNTDKIAEDLYRDDPIKKKIYDTYIKDDKKRLIDVPGFLNRAVEGIQEGAEGQAASLNMFNDNAASDIYNSWKQQGESVSAGEKGWYKTLGDMGHMAGFVGEMAAGGNLMKGMGMPANVANKFIVGQTFLGKSIQEGNLKFPDNKLKALASGAANTIGFMLLPDIVPSGKVGNVLGGIKKEVNQSLAELGDEAVSKAAIRDAINNGFKKGLEVTGAFAKQHGKSVLEMTALAQMGRYVDKALGMPSQTFEHYHPNDELEKTAKMMAIVNIIPSGIAGFGDYKNIEATKNSIWDIANNPEPYTNILEGNKEFFPVENNTKKEILEKIGLIKEAKVRLDENDIPEKQQKSYLLHSLNEKSLTQKAENTNEPTFKKKYQEEAKRSHEIKEGILKGISEEKIIENQAIKEVKGMYNDGYLSGAASKELETIKTEGGEGKFDEAKVVPFLKQVAEGTKKAPDNIQKIADEMFPEIAHEEKPLVTPEGKATPIEKTSDQTTTQESHVGEVENKNLNDVTSDNKSISEIGTKEEYYQYLRTIFPNSVVNGKIFFHRGGEKITKFDKNRLKQEEDAFYFHDNKKAEGYGKESTPAVLNIIKPTKNYPHENKEAGTDKDADASIVRIYEKDADVDETLKSQGRTADDLVEYGVYSPDQIHILGSKEDIEGFKKWKSEQTINETTKEPANNIPLIKTEENASPIPERKSETLLVDETPGSSSEVGTRIPKSEEPSRTQGEDQNKGQSEEEILRLTHADTEQIYKEAGLPERLETSTKHREQLEKEANEQLEKGYDFNKVADEVMNGDYKFEDKDQLNFARKVADLKAQQKGLDIKSPEFENIQNQIERLSRASDVAGTLMGRSLQARKNFVPVEETISDYVTSEKESAGVETLTDKQKETVQKEYEDISKAKKDFEEYMAKKEADFAAKMAKAAFEKQKSTSSKTKKTHADHVEYRKKVVEDIREKLKKARGDTQATIVPYAKELIAIAPDVAKLMKDLVEEGVSKLEDVVKNIHGQLKDDIEGLKEKDIHDIIAGVYNEKKTPRSELATKLFDLKREAQYVNKLFELLSGEEPKTEKARIERNKNIVELKKHIKNISEFEKDVEAQKAAKVESAAKEKSATEKGLTKAEKEIDTADARAKRDKEAAEEKESKRVEREAESERKRLHREAESDRKKFEREFEKEKMDEEKAKLKLKLDEAKRIEKELAFRTPEERTLDRMKTKMSNEIKELEYKLKTGDFDKESAPKKPSLQLDEEGLKIKDKLIKLRQDRAIRLLQQEYSNRSKYEKFGQGMLEVMNVPRTVMSSMDFSAPLRQGLIASISHPRTAGLAGIEMFKHAFSQKAFDRWFYDLKESKNYKLMNDSELHVSDPHDPHLSAKEEAFMNNLAEKIPLVGKIIKGSERAYVSYLNKMRVDLFNRFAERFREQGKTFENSPELYKSMADYINNSTGRGKLLKVVKLDIEAAAPVLNSFLFAPRLIASRLNLLGIGDVATLGHGMYGKMPKQIRVMAVKDMLKFVGLGMTILGLAKLNGSDVEDDPRSSDFGKIKSGNTRWDIWGGFQPYVRVFAQMVSGEKKSSVSNQIKELNGEQAFGETRGDVLERFGRTKLAPVPGAIWDFLSRRKVTGEKVSIGSEIEEHLTPLLYQDVKDAMKEKGISSLFTVGIPSAFGVGTQTYGNDKQPQKQSRPHRQTRQ